MRTDPFFASLYLRCGTSRASLTTGFFPILFFSIQGNMDQTPESPSTPPSWAARHKRLLFIGSGTLLLIVGLALWAFLYVRSGRLDRYIVSQVQTALAEYGLRAEVGNLDLVWGIRTAKVRDVKIYNQETGQLVATLDNAVLAVEIPNPFALRLQREIIFKRLD